MTDSKQEIESNLPTEEQSIRPQLRDLQAEDRGNYVVEYGIRITDETLVFHFFPPMKYGEFTDWDDSYQMDKRLEAAIPEVFDTDRITAGYADELKSFYVLCGGYGKVIDVRLLAKRFLDSVDRSLSS